MSQQPDRFYFGIHALRGVAAMLVLLSHAIHLANVAAASAHKLPIGIGRLGVMIFFSISGFVIALNRHQDVREFALRRFIRIYPTNWIALILAGMMMPLIGSAISLDIRSIFLVPTPSSGWSGTPNWTLVYEVAFYAIAAGLFAMRLSDRTLSIICILWVAAINLIAPDITRKEIWQVTTNILWSPLMQALPIGFLCALHFNRLSRIPPALLIAIATLAFAVALHLPDPTNNRYFFYSVATTSLVVALADRVPYNRIAALFGNASYGIYLIHVAVLLLITHSGLVTGKSFGFILAACLLICVPTSLAFGLFDHWLHKNLRRLVETGQVARAFRSRASNKPLPNQFDQIALQRDRLAGIGNRKTDQHSDA